MQLTADQYGQLLQTDPESVTWPNPPHPLVLRKNPSGSLGFKIKVLPFKNGSETVTVVYGIQPHCTIQDPGLLSNFDRIISIDSQVIVHLKNEEVFTLLKSHTGPEVKLGIAKVKTRGKLSLNFQSSTLQRLHSGTSSDSGRGSSPRSGGTGNENIFSFLRPDVRSASSSDRDSVESPDETVQSKQSASIKRSASGSSSLSGGTVCRKRLLRKNNGQDGVSGDQLVCQNGRITAAGCPKQNLVIAPISRVRLSGEDSDPDVVHSVPEGASLSNLYTFDSPFRDEERTQSLPLNSLSVLPQGGDSHAYSSFTCTCRGESNSYSSLNIPPVDMAASDLGVDRKAISGIPSKCSSKVLPTNVKKAESCTDCLTKTQQILKDPHRVLWDPNTKVVNLQRSSKKVPLGFTFKVKMSRNKDGTAEVYTLVEQVRKGGLADGHLFVGDWIRSVDGKPLHDAKEALGMTKHLEKSESMRFVIQRPVDMKRQTGETKSLPMEDKSKSSKHGSYTPSTSVVGMQVVPEDPGYCMACNYNLPEELTAKGRNSDRSLKLDRLPSTLSQGTGSNNSGRRSSPRTPPICTCPKSTVSDNFRRSASTVSEPIDWWRLCKSFGTMEETVKCPCLQLFIAGSHALKMAEILLGNSKVLANSSGKEKFLSIQCYVTEDLDGTTKISARDDLPEKVLLNSVISQCSDSLNCVCEDDIQLDIATQAGSDLQQRSFSRLTSRSQGSSRSVIGLDIYVVLDDKFFSHCCHFMFSKNSIFVLTFDGSKVLDNTSEMRKMGQMVHSTRSFSGTATPLYLYGFLDGEGSENLSPRADELQALFYTDHGRQILRYPNVTMPNFVTMKPSGIIGEDQIYGLRQLLGHHVLQQDFLHGEFHLATLPARAFVMELRQRGRAALKLSELYEGIGSFLPDITDMELTKLIKELQASGSIRLTDVLPSRIQTDPASLSQQVHIQPATLLQTAQSLLTGLERTLKNSPRETIPGFKCPTSATKSQLVDALLSAESHSVALGFIECNIVSLEKLSVIQGVKSCPDVYFIPYFCGEQPTADPSLEQKDHYWLFVKLHKVVSTSVFTRLVLELAQLCRSQEFSLECLEESTLTLEDWSVILHHIWKEDVIKITLRSEKVNLNSPPPQGFLRHLLQACRTILPKHVPYHLGPPCPLGEECALCKEGQLHVINLLQHEPIHCGEIRLDTRKDMKIWLASLNPQDKLSGYEDSLTNTEMEIYSREPPDPPDPDENRYDRTTPVLSLPYSLLHSLFLQLNVPKPQGNDWTGFAGTIGKSSGEVALYQIQKNPAQELLSDWARTRKATVGDLLNVLCNPDMDRLDLVQMVKESLKIT